MDKVQVSAELIKQAREKSGAGVMNCRDALIKAEGDMARALQILKEQGLLAVAKKATRTTAQGVVDCYVHAGDRIGVLVEVNCETDFVARTCEFKELAHNLAMQIAALSPKCVSKDQLPEGADDDPAAVCLLSQPFIKDTARTVQDIVAETIAKTGENIRVSRFVRFELGGQ